jgi:hypothetical protein
MILRQENMVTGCCCRSDELIAERNHNQSVNHVVYMEADGLRA